MGIDFSIIYFMNVEDINGLIFLVSYISWMSRLKFINYYLALIMLLSIMEAQTPNGVIMAKILKDDLGEFCYCEECTAYKGSIECRDILDTDGLTQATDCNGCGFIKG